MSGSSSSSPPCGVEVSSLRQPQAAVRDKTMDSSSRQAARPAREDQWTVRPRVAPSGTGASESQRSAPRQANPPRRSEERPASACQLYDGSDRPVTPYKGADSGGSRQTRSRRLAHRRRRSKALPHGACSPCLSGAAEPRTSMCPSSPAAATVQPPPSRRPRGQPPSGRGSILPPLRRWTKAEQPPSWRARSAQPPNKACRAARRGNPRSAPRCEFSTLDFLL
jgi:hypothetical protein